MLVLSERPLLVVSFLSVRLGRLEQLPWSGVSSVGFPSYRLPDVGGLAGYRQRGGDRRPVLQACVVAPSLW